MPERRRRTAAPTQVLGARAGASVPLPMPSTSASASAAWSLTDLLAVGRAIRGLERACERAVADQEEAPPPTRSASEPAPVADMGQY
jgi:hypothetical protein